MIQRIFSVLMLGACAIGLAGCPRDGGTASPPPSRDGMDFAAAQQTYLAGDYRRARDAMAAVAASGAGEQAVEARYWQGMASLELGEYDAARKALRQVMARSESRPLRALAYRGMAKSYYAGERWAEAEDTLRRLLILFPDDIDVAETLRSLEDCARMRGDAEAAGRYHEELVRRHPDSPYAAWRPVDAVRDAGSPRSGLHTVQCGVFSDETRARDLAARVRRAGVEAAVFRRRGGRTLWVVQAGSFSTRAGAARRAAQLERRGIPSIIKP